MTNRRLRVGILATHPIQYYAPWYRALARDVDLQVFFSHRQTAQAQADAGFGVAFDWDVPLLEGYASTFLPNVASHPDTDRFWGCNTPAIAKVIRDGAFDAFIVHGWSTWSYWQAIRACWKTGTPVLVRGDSNLATPRAAWTRAIKWPLYRWFIPRFDAYLVVGARAKAYLVHYGADPARCVAAPHAVDNDFFASRSSALRTDRPAIRRDFGLDETGVTFLFAGRFVGRKEPLMFVRAIAEAAAMRPGIEGLMVGDGPLRRDAEALAAQLSAPVTFAGFLNQTALVRAYAAADALVVPSEWETWALVVNEAMACGLPAIVSDGVGCADDLVTAGETGEVFPVGREHDLARSILAVASDEAYRRRLGAAAARRIESYGVAAAVAGTLRAIGMLTTRSKSSRVRVEAARIGDVKR